MPTNPRTALQEFVKTKVKATRMVVVSNRQPYVHTYEGDRVVWRRPAGGVVPNHWLGLDAYWGCLDDRFPLDL